MPQMKPTFWTILMLFTLMSICLIMIILYFIYLNILNIKNSFIPTYSYKKNWKWMW